MDFRRQVADLRESIGREIVTEAELRSKFVDLIRDYLKERFGIPVHVELERTVVRGRTDARIGALVLEFEAPPKQPSPKNDALLNKAKQARGYLIEYSAKGVVAQAICSDGVRCLFLDEKGNVVDQGDLVEKSWVLEEWIATLGLKVATPEMLLSIFGPSSATCKAMLDILWELFEKGANYPFVQEAFSVWQRVYGCNTNLSGKAQNAVVQYAKNNFALLLRGKKQVETFLFLIETYLSLLLKLLLAVVTVQRLLAGSANLEELLGTDQTQTLASLDSRIPLINGVFEHDVFLWFADLTREDSRIAERMNSQLRRFASHLDTMDFHNLGADVLRHMYQTFFDRETRIALGEFYTKEDIVDEVLDAVGYTGSSIVREQLLDPACGSGTFLVRAIERFKREARSLGGLQIVRSITNQIKGIDIHPFAVAMARVNYILSIADLFTPNIVSMLERKEPLRIPVFWSDSLASFSSPPSGAAYPLVPVDIPILGRFSLPDPMLFPWALIFDLTHDAILGKWTSSRLIQEFEKRTQNAKLVSIYQKEIEAFFSVFQERDKRGENGRWIATLRNLVSAASLDERCDYVVGNPPWVRIHNIDKKIVDNLRQTCRSYGSGLGWDTAFSQGRIPFRGQVDYCMAFIDRALAFLKKGGKLGYVITSKIAPSLYANLLRSRLVTETTLTKIIDYSLSATPLFEDASNYPMIIACVKELPSGNAVEMTVHNCAQEVRTWRVPQNELVLVDGDWQSPWMMAPPKVIRTFRTMQKGGKRLGDLTTVNMGIKTSANDLYFLLKLNQTSDNRIVLGELESHNWIRIEKQLVRPSLRGGDVYEWHIKPSRYMIWTHDDSSGLPLNALPSNASQHFSKHEDVLRRRDDYRADLPYWAIFRVTPTKLKDKIAWRELAKKIEACFVPKSIEDPILGDSQLIVDHTVYFFAAPETEVGLASTALLNSVPIRAFMASFVARARGAWFRHFSWSMGMIPIPNALADDFIRSSEPFGKGAPKEMANDLRRLADIAKSMYAKRTRDLLEEVDSIVARLFRLNESDLEELREYFRFMTARK